MHRYIALAISIASAPFISLAANDYNLPENIQDGNILHCFNWTIAQVTEELPAIAEAGFGAVQLSPLQGNCSPGAEWYYAYLPYDFLVRPDGPGNRVELKTLCQEAEKYGVKVIVDVVANHINGSSAYRASKWNNTDLWHASTFKNINYSSRQSITHDNLGDYPDLNSEHEDVRKAVASYIETLKGYGVKGIRWDAAKHISLPSERCDFWPDVTAAEGLWHYGELLDSPGGDENKLVAEYTDYMSVTDSRYSSSLLTAVRAGRAATATGLYTTRGIDASQLVYWAESHDTYANNGGATKNVKQDVIDRTWALGACRQGATALYLSRPSKTAYSDIRMGEKGSMHFTEPQIAAVNRLRNAMGNTPEYLDAADGVTTITRGGGGACIVVSNGQSRDVTVKNGASYVLPGTYTDEVSGNTFTVTDSEISGTVGSTGIAVIMGGGSSGVSAPVLDPSTFTEEYYTLQGIRVASIDAPGIYLIRRGASVEKRIVR